MMTTVVVAALYHLTLVAFWHSHNNKYQQQPTMKTCFSQLLLLKNICEIVSYHNANNDYSNNANNKKSWISSLIVSLYVRSNKNLKSFTFDEAALLVSSEIVLVVVVEASPTVVDGVVGLLLLVDVTVLVVGSIVVVSVASVVVVVNVVVVYNDAHIDPLCLFF